ncbi:MAG: hypothetical protein M3R23_02685 [Actinomycetota bacterium]|nr:hypothetical protein [Actinomycetota bacterium]
MLVDWLACGAGQLIQSRSACIDPLDQHLARALSTKAEPVINLKPGLGEWIERDRDLALAANDCLAG